MEFLFVQRPDFAIRKKAANSGIPLAKGIPVIMRI
jgi:hypothetical protein